MDYDVLLAQHRDKGGRLASVQETNVRLWTYAAISEMVEEGGRMCEGMSGLFAVADFGSYEMLGSAGVAAAVRDTVTGLENMNAWKMREEQQGCANDEGVERDTEDASQSAARKDQDGVMDLAERLDDARVGTGNGDVEMEDLDSEFGSMKAK
jgi:hypothetical protein